MAPSSPTVARWELALRIRNRRRELGLHVTTITTELNFSRNYWSTVENERTVLSETKMKALLQLFGFDADERQELLDLREAAKQHGWWTRYRELDDTAARLIGLEHGADSVRTYEELLITGLLQTRDYARTLMVTDPAVSPVAVEERLELRMRRQERLGGPDPLRLTAVMSQAAILQQIGGPEILRRQLQHLATLIEDRPETIDVRVLPFTATPGGVIGSSTMYLLDFGSPYLHTVAWREAMATLGIVDDPITVRHLVLSYEQALKVCLSREESLDLIKRTAATLEG